MAEGGLTLKRHYRSDQNAQFLLNITPETAQWKYISFKVARLSPHERIEANTATEEVVIVPLVGRGKLLLNDQTHELTRKDLFRELADIAYLPPRTNYKLEAIESFEVAIGGAPAEGKLPARIIRRNQIPSALPKITIEK
jgi:5-deoxy-glucuronate isomerase